MIFPADDRWELPVRGWHFDFMPASVDPRPVHVFAFLNEVRPRGGGTLVLTGSHRVVEQYLRRGEAFRMPPGGRFARHASVAAQAVGYRRRWR